MGASLHHSRNAMSPEMRGKSVAIATPRTFRAPGPPCNLQYFVVMCSVYSKNIWVVGYDEGTVFSDRKF